MDASASKKGGTALKDSDEIVGKDDDVKIEGYGGDRKIVEEKTKLSLEVLLASDGRQLGVFIDDMANLSEEARKKQEEELAKSADAKLKELDSKINAEGLERARKAKPSDESDEPEVEKEPGEFFDNGEDLAGHIFMIVESEDDLKEKVEQINKLLDEIQRRNKIIEERKAAVEAVDAPNKGLSKVFLKFLAGLSGFALLSPEVRAKLKSMHNAKIEDTSRYFAKALKHETGEDIDPQKMFLAASLGGVDFSKADADKNIVDWARDAAAIVEGNSYVPATERFAAFIDVPFGIMNKIGMSTISDLGSKVMHLYEDEVKSVIKDPEEAEEAWKKIEDQQKVVMWAENYEDEIMDRFMESIDRNNNDLDEETMDEIKASVNIGNLRVAQAAMIMFGDADLIGKELLRGTGWAGRSINFVKALYLDRHGAKDIINYWRNGHHKIAKPISELAEDASKLAKAAALNPKKIDDALTVLKSLDKQIDQLSDVVDEAFDSKKPKLTEAQLVTRTKAIDGYLTVRKDLMEGFKEMSKPLAREAQLLDVLAKNKGAALADLKLSAFDDVLGKYGLVHNSTQSAADVWKKINPNFAKKAAYLAEAQDKIMASMKGAQGKLVAKMERFDDFLDAAKDLINRGKIGKENQELLENIHFWGKVKNWTPRLALPVFSVGSTLYTAVSQRQGFKKTGLMLAEAGLSFVPFVGGTMDIYLGARGYDLAGNKLSLTSRLLYGGFGAVGLVADMFGAYPVRAGIAAITKGRRSVKAVKSLGETKSVLLRGMKKLSKGVRGFGKEGRHATARNAEMMQKAIKYRQLETAVASGKAVDKAKMSALKTELNGWGVLDELGHIKPKIFQKAPIKGQGLWRGANNFVRNGVNMTVVAGSKIPFGFRRFIRQGQYVYYKFKNVVFKAKFGEAKRAWAAGFTVEKARRKHELTIKNLDTGIDIMKRRIAALKAKGNKATAEDLAKLEKYETKLSKQLTRRSETTVEHFEKMNRKQQMREIKRGMSKGLRFGDAVLARVEKLTLAGGAVAGLAFLVSQGNVGPSDLGKYAVKGADMAADAVSYGVNKFNNPSPRHRAADQVIAAIVRDRQIADLAINELHNQGGVKNEMETLASHIDSPAAQLVATRSGIDPLELARGDSGKKVSETI